jgi:hypothetical protein
LKKNYFSSHKLPKQQSTIFWSQGILGVKDDKNPMWCGSWMRLDALFHYREGPAGPPLKNVMIA